MGVKRLGTTFRHGPQVRFGRHVRGEPIASVDLVASHHSLSDLTNYDDHPQYLYLAGRIGAAQIVVNAVNTDGVLRLNAITGTAAGVDIFSVERTNTQWMRVAGDGQTYLASSTTAGILNILGNSGGTVFAIGTSPKWEVVPSSTEIGFKLSGSSQNLRIFGTASGTSFTLLTLDGPVKLKSTLILEDPGAGTNTVTLQAPTAPTSHTLTLPLAQGAASTVLTNDGAGAMSWSTASGLTSLGAPTAGDVIAANTTPAWARVAAGTDTDISFGSDVAVGGGTHFGGQVLRTRGTAGPPIWAAPKFYDLSAGVLEEFRLFSGDGGLCNIRFNLSSGYGGAITIKPPVSMAATTVTWAFLETAQTWGAVQSFPQSKLFIVGDVTAAKTLQFKTDDNTGSFTTVLQTIASGNRTVSMPNVNSTLVAYGSETSAQPVAGAMLYGAGTGASMLALTIGSANKVLTTNGSVPSWSSETLPGVATVLAGLAVAQTFIKPQIIDDNTDATERTILTLKPYSGADTGVPIVSVYDRLGIEAARIGNDGSYYGPNFVFTPNGLAGIVGIFAASVSISNKTWTFPNVTGTVPVVASLTSISTRVGFFTGSLGQLTHSSAMTFASNTLTVTNIGATTFSAGFTMADAQNVVLNATTGTKIGTATTQKLGFYNAPPVAQGAALTAQLTSLTHTAPGTPDYAIQDLTAIGGFGFVTKDEGNTVLSVILNLQTRVAQLEARLSTAGGGCGIIA